MLTSFDIAKLFKVTPTRVRELARVRGVGTKFAGVWLFTEEDIDKLRPLGRGRPKGRRVKR